MAEQRPYKIRQAILAVLSNIYPAGRDVTSLLRAISVHDDYPYLAVTREEVVQELPVLISAGYIVDVRRGKGDPYLKIQNTGMEQIRRRDADPDAAIWGESAL